MEVSREMAFDICNCNPEKDEETKETMKDRVYGMIEVGHLRSEICARLGISTADYWEIKKEWMERKKRDSDERREFYRLRVNIHGRCKRLLMRLTEDVRQYCEEGTVEEIERILEALPLVNDKGKLQKDMEVLRDKEKDIEGAKLKSGVKRREEGIRAFRNELKNAESRRLRSLDKYATQHRLSFNEKVRMARRIKGLYHLKKV